VPLGIQGFPWKSYTTHGGIVIGLPSGFGGLICGVGIGLLTRFWGPMYGINVEASMIMNLTRTDQFQWSLMQQQKAKAEFSDLRLCG
jgi:hypothetical protein